MPLLPHPVTGDLPKFHTHGTGGEPAPWHRAAHCADGDLPPHLRHKSLFYVIVEIGKPRRIKGAAPGEQRA